MNWEALSAIADLVGVALVIISVIMQRLINTYISAVRMDSKSLVDSQEVAIFGDICLAMILTPGGRQWWKIIGPYFTVHDQINARIESEGDTFPCWTEMVPFSRPDGRAS